VEAGTKGTVRQESDWPFLETASVTTKRDSSPVEMAKRALIFLPPESIVSGARV
jgi:hypothetical protein